MLDLPEKMKALSYSAYGGGAEGLKVCVSHSVEYRISNFMRLCNSELENVLLIYFEGLSFKKYGLLVCIKGSV